MVEQTASRGSGRPLDMLAVALSLVGLVLCAGGALGMLTVVLPEPPAFDLWFYLTIAGAFGLFLTGCGLLLGLLVWLPARRQHSFAPTARRAVVLSAIALGTYALALLASQFYVWITG